MTPESVTAIMLFLANVRGTPYVLGGNSLSGTDCSGLAAWVANIASGRDAFSGRFSTGNEEEELAARGFREGTAPGALVIGWNGHHTAITLPDGTAVASGEQRGNGGIEFGGDGAYQAQFTRHMYLPVDDPTPNPLEVFFSGLGQPLPPPDAPPPFLPPPPDAVPLLGGVPLPPPPDTPTEDAPPAPFRFPWEVEPPEPAEPPAPPVEIELPPTGGQPAA